ncbi:MAG: cyclic nucleotide-binding domain-containing protein [Chthoniobacteraceae bacterium]
MSQDELRTKLRNAPIFREFTDRDVSELLNLLELANVPAGTAIVRQDDLGDAMYVVIAGQCRVVHHKGGRDIELGIIKEGDFFGEIALVDHGPRSADVIALTDTTFVTISQAVISALAGVHPGAAFKLVVAIGRIVVERLRHANERYVDSLLFPLQGKD